MSPGFLFGYSFAVTESAAPPKSMERNLLGLRWRSDSSGITKVGAGRTVRR
jgi:hypothetical protein